LRPLHFAGVWQGFRACSERVGVQHMQWIKELGVWLWAVINNWAGYSTGGLIVAVVALWGLLKNKPTGRKVTRKIGLRLALLFLFLGFFKGWRDQYEKANDLQMKLDQRPSIVVSPQINVPPAQVVITPAPASKLAPAKGTRSETIQVSLECSPDRLPVEIPPRSGITIVPLNKARHARSSAFILYSVPNKGATPMMWPDAARLQEVQKQQASSGDFIECKVRNLADEQNLSELDIPLDVQYGGERISHSNKVHIPVLNHGKAFQFYVLNDCPVASVATLPQTGTATVVGESTSREFKIENQQHVVTSNTLGPSAGDWSGTTCE
jgi:hypothetical protein